MTLLARGTRAAARPLRQTVNRAQSKRYASHGHDIKFGEGESALNIESANSKGTEGLGVRLNLGLSFSRRVSAQIKCQDKTHTDTIHSLERTSRSRVSHFSTSAIVLLPATLKML